MLKSFFRDSAVYGTAKLLTGSIAFLSLPIYARALGPADYGAVDLVTTIAAIAHVTVALEVSQGFGRFVLAPEAGGRHAAYASTAFWFTLAAYSLFVAIVLPFAGGLSSWLFGSADYAATLRVATLVIWSTGLFYMVQNILRYERRTIQYAVASIVFSALSVGVTVVMLLVLHSGLVGVFVGQFCAGLAATALGLWFGRDTVVMTFDQARWRQMLAFSLPLVPSSLGVLLTTYVDRYAIVRLLTLEDLGHYSVAFRLASIVGVALAGFMSAVAPLVYQHHGEPGTPAQLARIFQWFLAMAVPLVLFLGLFSQELVPLVASQAYQAATPLVAVLGASMLLASCYAFSPGLLIAKLTGWVAVIGFVTGATNLALNFVLVPRLGLIGAAWSSAISAALGGACHFVFGQRYYPVPFHWGRVAMAAALVVAGLGLSPGVLAAPLPVRALAWPLISIAALVVLIGPHDLALLRHHVAARFKRPGWAGISQ